MVARFIVAACILFFVAFNQFSTIVYAASDYRLPQIKALDNGFRYIISEASDPEGTITLDLLQIISANDEFPGEEGLLSLYRLIPPALLTPEFVAFAPEQQLSMIIGHGDFGLEPSVRTGISAKRIEIGQYADLLGPLVRYARLTSPDGEMIQSAFAALPAGDAKINKKQVFTSGSSVRRFSIPGPKRLAEVARDAFFADRQYSRLSSDRAPSASAVRAFLRRTLSPSRTVLVVAGAVDKTQMEQAIKRAFGTWQPANGAEEPVARVVAPLGASRHIETAEDQISYAGVQIAQDSLAFQAGGRLGLFDQSLHEVVAEHLGSLIKASLKAQTVGENRGVSLSAYADRPGFVLRPDVRNLSASSQNMTIALDLLARVRQHGLPPQSINQVRRALLERLAFAVDGVSGDKVERPKDFLIAKTRAFATLKAAGLHSAYIDRFGGVWGTAPVRRAHGISSADLADRAKRLSTDRIQDTARRIVSGRSVKLATIGPRDDTAILAPAIDLWAKLLSEDLEPLEAEAEAKFAYQNFGAPGRVIAREDFTELDAKKFTFGNNVVLLYRHAPELGQRARFNVSIGDPDSIATRADSRIRMVLEKSIYDLPLGQHSSTEISDFRAQSTALNEQSSGYALVNLTAQIGFSMLDMDFEIALKYAAARLSDSIYETSVFSEAIEGIVASIKSDTPRPRHMRRVNTSLPEAFGGTPVLQADRWDFKDPSNIPSMDTLVARAQDLLEQQAVRVVYVGPRSEEAVIALVAKTLGALKKRRPLALSAIKPAPAAIPVGKTVSQPLDLDDQIPAVAFYLPISRLEGAEAYLARSVIGAAWASDIRARVVSAGFGGVAVIAYTQTKYGHGGGDYLKISAHGEADILPTIEAMLRDVLSDQYAPSPDQVMAARDDVYNRLAVYNIWPAYEADILSRYGESRRLHIMPEKEGQVLTSFTPDRLKELADQIIPGRDFLVIRYGY